jgi:hypothetical protein
LEWFLIPSLKAVRFERLSVSADRESPSQQALRCGKKLSIFTLEESKNCFDKVPFGLWKKLWKAEEPFFASDLQVATGSIRPLFIAL